MRRISVLLASAALMAAPLASMSTASAGTVSTNDPEGDAPARFDVVHVVATNTPKAISTWVTFSDLKGSGEVLEFYFGQATDEELSYGIDVWREHGKLHVVVQKDDADGTRSHACKKAVGTWNQTTDVVHTYVPTSCLQGIVFHPLEILMRTSPPHAEQEADGVHDITVPRL
jgi:hypothetical protein